MIFTSLILAASAAFPVLTPSVSASATIEALAASKVEWSAPRTFVKGMPYEVTVRVTAGMGKSVTSAAFSPFFFEVDGKPLYQKSVDAGSPAPKVSEVPMAVGTKMEMTFDLEPLIEVEGDFNLGYLDSAEPSEPMMVRAYRLLGEETNFYEELAPAADGTPATYKVGDDQLAGYHVVMETIQGQILMQFWPDVAPNTVRNFLDLAHTGFYDGILFHRCIPGFVIQGGDPNTKGEATNPMLYGTGGGPRKVDAEFNDKKHTRGVLSMARFGQDPNSATSQFFICHERVPALDGRYTAFGVLLDGYNVVEDIIAQPMAIDQDFNNIDPATGRPARVPTDRPAIPQRIHRAAAVVPLSK